MKARRRFVTTAVGALLLIGGAAFAYWTSHGFGSANAAAGTLAPPTGVTVPSSVAGSTVHVSWTAPAPPGSGTVSYYVQRFPGPNPACGTSPTSLITTTSCDDIGVVTGTYTYKVTAVWRTWTAQSAASGSVAVQNDTTPPVIARVVVADATNHTAGFLTQGGSYFAYAQVTDTGSGVNTVTADVSTLTTGASSLAMSTTSGPWTIGGLSYNYRTASQTAKNPLLETGNPYPFTITATDVASNTSSLGGTANVDNTKPVTTASPSPAANGAGWNNSNVTITLSATDTSGSGVNHITYSESGAQTLANTTYSGTFQITTDGTTTISYFATDNIGNIETIKTLVIKLDKTNPANVLSLVSKTGGGSFLSGTTLYYQGSVAGTFKIQNALTDVTSGPASTTYAAFGGTSTGWTHTTPDVQNTPATGPYVSNTFSWAASTSTSPTETVTGADTAGNSAPTTLTLTNDTAGPTGGSISVPGFSTSTSVSVTFSAGTDALSGVNTGSGQLSRASVSYNSSTGQCASFGGATFSNIGSAGPSSPFSDPGLSSGNCYEYRHTVSDNVGNSTTYTSNPVAVDTTVPTITSLVTANHNSTAGKMEQTDTITITFSKQMAAQSICSAWANGSSGVQSFANFTVHVSNTSGANDLTISSAASCPTFNFGDINLGSGYVTSTGGSNKPQDFSNSTIGYDGTAHTLRITLGSAATGGSAGTLNTVASSILQLTLSTSVTDIAGNATSPNTKSTGNVQQF